MREENFITEPHGLYTYLYSQLISKNPYWERFKFQSVDVASGIVGRYAKWQSC
jgi:hypothetical protein